MFFRGKYVELSNISVGLGVPNDCEWECCGGRAFLECRNSPQLRGITQRERFLEVMDRKGICAMIEPLPHSWNIAQLNLLC